jgi:magnesium transporter
MLTIRRIADGRVTSLDREDAAGVLHGTDGVVWVDLVEPVANEQGFLRSLGLHPLVVGDVLEEELHPKVDTYPEYLFLVAHGVNPDATSAPEAFETLELDVVIGRNCLVTHAVKRLPAVDIAAGEVERDPALGSTPDRLLHEVLDTMVDRYLTLFEHIDDRIDAVEDALLTDRPPLSVRNEIFQLRRTVTRLQRIAVPQAHTIARLASLAAHHAEDGDGDGDKAERLYRDIADKLNRIADLTTSYRSQLDGAQDQYQTAVGNAQNEIMKVLTMVSAVLLPITVIAGIYGMNFQFMPELDERWGYPAVWGVIIMIVLVVLTVFRRRGWISSPREGDPPAPSRRT